MHLGRLEAHGLRAELDGGDPQPVLARRVQQLEQALRRLVRVRVRVRVRARVASSSSPRHPVPNPNPNERSRYLDDEQVAARDGHVVCEPDEVAEHGCLRNRAAHLARARARVRARAG